MLYNLWLFDTRVGFRKYDQFVHAYGFGITTWICWQAIRRQLSNPVPRPGVLLLVALAAMGLGAFNEVIESAATRLVERTNVGGYENNAWDLVFNLLGCIIAAAVIWINGRAKGGSAA